jgi:hypothetical protein
VTDRRGQRRCSGCARAHVPASPRSIKFQRVAHVESDLPPSTMGHDDVLSPCAKVPRKLDLSAEDVWGDDSLWDLGPDDVAPAEAPDLYPPMHTQPRALAELPRPTLLEGDLSATTAAPMRVDVPYLPHLLGRPGALPTSTVPEPVPDSNAIASAPKIKTSKSRSKNEREADGDIDQWDP